MRNFALVILTALALTACGKGVSEKPTISRIEVSVAGKPSVLELKSGLMRVLVRESPDPHYNYARYCFTLGNFDLTDNKALERALNAENAIIVYFEILGPTGSNKETPLTAGAYTSDAKELPKYESPSLAIFTFVNGKQTWTLSKTAPVFETKGEVKITGIQGDVINGEINVTTGAALAAKGQFVAQRVFDKPTIEAPK